MLKAIKAVLGFDGVGNTALKIVDKIAGTDWTPADKAEFILKHAEATKHQSPTRRILAITIAAEQIMLVTVWTIAAVAGHLLDLASGLALAKDVSAMLVSNVNMSMNGILAFYFLIGMKK
tara:strand:+ start:504 stop:863 length:360 start_codon:yes stop_codon:yes gene_type:complete